MKSRNSGNYESSIRISTETSNACLAIQTACRTSPALSHVDKKTILGMGIFYLTQMTDAEIDIVESSMPVLGVTTSSTPLRLSKKFHALYAKPMVARYSKVVCRSRGINLSQITIRGIHALHMHLEKKPSSFLALITSLKVRQRDLSAEVS
jgi:hypothetical protein